MILTRKRLLVDIFLTSRLSKSLAFCEFANVNFEPWAKPLLTIFIFFRWLACLFAQKSNIWLKHLQARR